MQQNTKQRNKELEDKIYENVSNRIIIAFGSFSIILLCIGFVLGFIIGSL